MIMIMIIEKRLRHVTPTPCSTRDQNALVSPDCFKCFCCLCGFGRVEHLENVDELPGKKMKR